MFAIKNTKKIKTIFSKIPFFVAKHAIFFFLGFLIVAIAIVGINIFLDLSRAQKEKREVRPPKIQINEGAYEQFLKNYSERESRISPPEIYSDIFFRR